MKFLAHCHTAKKGDLGSKASLYDNGKYLLYIICNHPVVLNGHIIYN